ncbi:lysylphosphatidylglycerol synthase transmembrane domain-containing protein [Sphingomonas sp. MMS24-JH45]
MRGAIHAIPPDRIAAALALTAVSYLMLTFYDLVALRVVGKPLPWRTAAVGSFAGYTLSHNLGLALLTGGSARLRIYTRAGLDPDVARVIEIASATFWAGIVTVAGMAMVARSGPDRARRLVAARPRAARDRRRGAGMRGPADRAVRPRERPAAAVALHPPPPLRTAGAGAGRDRGARHLGRRRRAVRAGARRRARRCCPPSSSPMRSASSQRW